MKRFLAMLMLVQVAHAEPLGRLFFTPDERALLDRIRTLPASSGGSPGATGSVEIRGGGKTVWENGIPKHLEPRGRK